DARHESHEPRNSRKAIQSFRVFRDFVCFVAILRQRNYVVAAVGTPRMARFTRLRISGTLYPLYRSVTAPSTAILPARSAVASSRALPTIAVSTFGSRFGVAATAPTTSRAATIFPFENLIADATLTSGKSHTCRSRTFSK